LKPRVLTRDEHGITHEMIDADALRVVERLKEAGYTAYLVGGSVRDLLTGSKPKDYDISTSALPDEIKEVFRRSCLLIGRRFRLAHIRVGRKIFEVSTFRAGNNEEEELIVRDNIWGSPEEDATRRDFSINGLFYDPEEECVIDYVGGWEDLQTRTIHSIGTPEARFRQDPVRMIRLLKFRARFGFAMADDCLNALETCKEEIVKSAPARVLEELLRMLESGASHDFFKLMLEHELLNYIIPELAESMQSEVGEEIFAYLKLIDEIHSRNERVQLRRAVLAAALLFPLVNRELEAYMNTKEKVPHLGEVTLICWNVVREVFSNSFTHFPKKLSSNTVYILTTQYRMTPLSGKKSKRLRFLSDHDFPHALHFLQMRALLDPQLRDTYFDFDELHKKAKKNGVPQPRRRPSRGRRSGRPRRARPPTS